MKTLYYLYRGTIRNLIWIIVAMALLVGCRGRDGTETPRPPSPCESIQCPDLEIRFVSGTRGEVYVIVTNIGDQAAMNSATVTARFTATGLDESDEESIHPLGIRASSMPVILRLPPHDPHPPYPPDPTHLTVGVFLVAEEKSKDNNRLDCDWTGSWSCDYISNSTAASAPAFSGTSPGRTLLVESKKELLEAASRNLTVSGPFTGKYFGVIQGVDDTFAPFLVDFVDGDSDLVGIELLPGLTIGICDSDVAVYDFFGAAEVTITGTSFTTNTLETNNNAQVILSGNLSQNGTALDLALKIMPNNNCGEKTLTATPQKLIFEADVSITKSASPNPAAAGDLLQYVLRARNDGPSFVEGITVEDNLPPGLSFVPASSTGDCVLSNAKLICTAGGLAAGATTDIVIGVRVNADLVYNAGGPFAITNQASVTGSAEVVDLDLSNNTTSLDTQVIAVADLEISSFEAIDPPREVLVGEHIEFRFKKELVSHGPSSPIKPKLINRVSVTTGDASRLDNAALEEMAPDENEQPEVLGEVIDTYTITCVAAGRLSFTFTTEIQPLNPEDVDPNQSNNVKSLQLDVECVLPVAIDVRTKLINLNSNRPITVLVLSNSSGEFDLPVAFNASMIDAASVRFGLYDAVWSETGGAPDTDGRGQRTRRGMRLHFRTLEAGLMEDTTLACLKGTWIDTDGIPRTFFGCDTVVIKD